MEKIILPDYENRLARIFAWTGALAIFSYFILRYIMRLDFDYIALMAVEAMSVLATSSGLFICSKTVDKAIKKEAKGLLVAEFAVAFAYLLLLFLPYFIRGVK